MNDKNLNEDLEKQKIGELLENIFKKKEELYDNCKDFFENYLSYSFNYFQNLKNLIIKYDKLKILGQYEEILVSFMIELAKSAVSNKSDKSVNVIQCQNHSISFLVKLILLCFPE